MPDIPDLWPSEIGAETSTVTPLAILRTAASQLGERTQQLIVGDVKQQVVYNSKFRLDFFIEAPTLDHYTVKLFTVEHSIDSFYPATGIFATGRIARSDTDAELASEKELQEWLKGVFSTPKTTKLINTLLQQLRS
jgi:hypothetical protein